LFNKKEPKMSKPHTPKPPYPVAFRQQLVELVQAGRNPNELAREFGCHVTSILSWVRRARLGRAGEQGVVALPLGTSEREELAALRRENRQLKLERDILSKATAWFANKSEKTFTASTNS
jgi:transposase